MEVNDVVCGFRLKKITPIKEIDGEGFLFHHEKSGAKLFFIKTDDDNKVFSIAFRTPPTNDTGVAHILEHSCLCGSRKYPLKEPFVELVKGSLNTFLNAMTYPDKTVYPVASRNPKDFRNLMDVYLDAVFYPKIYDEKEILMQEGWHYEVKDNELTLSGVVYNEMKGALSSADSLLSSKIMKSLYPDTTYGFESGGDPEAIPSLTLEDFLSFHKKYYHPANSYIYLYGDLDIEETLSYIDGEYLSKFDKIDVDSEVAHQPEFDGLKRFEEFYPCGEDEDTAEKTFLSLNYKTGDALDNETALGLQILEHALIDSSSSPLKKALIEKGLGKEVEGNYEAEILEPFFSVILNNSEAERADEFLKTVDETFRNLVQNGIDKELLQSAVNTFEFKLREADFGTAPKGLIYNLSSLRNFLYDGDPTAPLIYEPLIARMKKGVDDGYFERLIEKYFINNPHKTLVTLKPSQTMGKERDEALKNKLAKIKSSMTQEKLSEVKADGEKLLQRQEREETEEALRSIPILKLSDIRKKAYEYPLSEREADGVKILFSDIETNGISYVNLYFDASKVEKEDILSAYLLESIMLEVGTKYHSYEELGKLIDLNTGGIYADLDVITRAGDADNFKPMFKVAGKSLLDKLSAMFSLFEEVLNSSEFTDKKRMKERLHEIVVASETSMQRTAHQIVAEKLASYSSAAGVYLELGDLPFYRYVKGLLANFDDNFKNIVEDLKRVAKRIFTKENLIVSATFNKAYYEDFESELKKFVAKLDDTHFKTQKYDFKIERRNEGLMSSSQVQYVGKGANFIKLNHKFTGTLHVLETILRYDYFWTNIRVKGGAYGAFASLKRDGSLYFGSYRDPNLTETIRIFDATKDYLANFNVSDREMDKFIIGTFAGIDIPLTPKLKGDAAALCYLRGVSYEDRQKSRNEILSTRQADIRALSNLVGDAMNQNNLCVFGNEEIIKQNSDIFKETSMVMSD
ncbi:MAG: insulinase family protein [Selenomonadaceae bacterium]|nr:insulinase family protein [Selenomonadaceae bacterium]